MSTSSASSVPTTGVPGPCVDRSFQVLFDQLQETDRRASGQMATMFANALDLATTNGSISSQEARHLFCRFLGEEVGNAHLSAQHPTPERPG